MKTRTYQELQVTLEYLNKLNDTYNALAKCGIAKKNVHYFEMPRISSGYSMGERVDFFCGKTLIESVDDTRSYAKSCTWRPKHGYIKIVLTRSALDEYINLHIKLDIAKTRNDRAEIDEIERNIKRIVANNIDDKESVIKNKEMMIF